MPQREYHRTDIAWHIKSGLYPCYVRHDILSQIAGRWDEFPKYADPDGVIPWVHCRAHSAALIGDGNVPAAWHLDSTLQGHESDWPDPYPALLCKFGSGIAAMLQMGVLEGYNPIYLLGCDLGLKAHNPGEPDPNHFHPEYWSDYIVTQSSADRTELQLVHMHTIAKAWCDEHGVQILNATIGGVLEVYPRSDYNSLFK
jgi:hypothetical protein